MKPRDPFAPSIPRRARADLGDFVIAFFFLVFVAFINLSILAGAVAVVIWVLRAMGVIG